MFDLFGPPCKDQGFETRLNVKLPTIIEGPLRMYCIPEINILAINTRA
jgi:hypothetical protein